MLRKTAKRSNETLSGEKQERLQPQNKKAKRNSNLLKFVDVCDDAFHVIASFLNPPDVYSLCITSRCFHSINKVSLAKMLLDKSLFNSLRKTLQERHNFLDSFIEMSKLLPINSVVISGSTMTQTMLGEKYEKTDIDVYCEPTVAPVVRTWLIKKLNQVLIGWRKSYPLFNSDSSSDFPNRIHHVEHYATMPDEEQLINTGKHLWTFKKNDLQMRDEIKFVNDVEDVYAIKQVDDNAKIPMEQRLFCHLHGVLQKQFINVDLIITTVTSTVVDVIDDFDISICKGMFNGHFFTIPIPSKTFFHNAELSQSWRNEMVRSYVKHVTEEDETITILLKQSPEAFFRCMDQNTIHKLTSGTSIFSRDFDENYWIAKLRKIVINNAIAYMTDDHFSVHQHIDPICMHNLIIVKFVERTKKYSNRKITIMNMPSLSADIGRHIPKFPASRWLLHAPELNAADTKGAYAWLQSRMVSQFCCNPDSI